MSSLLYRCHLDLHPLDLIVLSSLLPSVDLSGSPSKTGTPVPFQLKTAVLVNNRLKQVKFSELGVDLYRLAMTLEPVRTSLLI